jgi:nitrogen fixation NifU-like protein
MNDERMQRYSEVIIEHSQFPRHHGRLDEPTHQGQGENPFCGDRVTVQLSVNAEGLIEQAAAESVGCAISIASASLLASHLQGLSVEAAEALFEQVRGIITDGIDESEEEQLGELAALGFARQYPSRVKCATLAWHVLKNALVGDVSVATTE